MSIKGNLFADEETAKSFNYALAYRKVKNIKKDEEAFSEDIEKAIDKCGTILEQNGANINYVEEIYKIDEEVQGLESRKSSSPKYSDSAYKKNDILREDLLLKRDNLVSEMNEFTKKLSMSVKEDLEFYSNQVLDRTSRKSTSNQIKKKIYDEYPDLDDFEIKKALKKYPFNIILGENTENFEVEEDNLVISIKKAPKILLEESEELNDEEKEEETKSMSTDTSFYGKDDELSKSIEKEELIESEDVSNEISEEEINKTNELMNSDFEYTMEEGDTLANIAMAICENEKGWYDIFSANKDKITEILINNNITDIVGIENNDKLFNGVTLNIPNVFTMKNPFKGE